MGQKHTSQNLRQSKQLSLLYKADQSLYGKGQVLKNKRGQMFI